MLRSIASRLADRRTARGAGLRAYLETLRADMRALRDQVAALDSAVTRLRADATLGARAERANTRVVGALRQEIAALRQEIAALRQEIAALRQEIAALRQQRAGDAAELAEVWPVQRAQAERLARSEEAAARLARDASAWRREALALAWEAHARAAHAAGGSSGSQPAGVRQVEHAALLASLVPPAEPSVERAERWLPHLDGCTALLALGLSAAEALAGRLPPGVSLRALEPDVLAARGGQARGLDVQAGAPLALLRSLPDESFDAVVSLGLAERLSDADLGALLVEARRVLRAGGRIVLALFRPDSLAALRVLRAQGELPPRLLRPDQARALLLAGGFQRVEIDASTIAAEAGAGALETGDEEPRYLVVARRSARQRNGRASAAPGGRANGTGVGAP